MPLPAVWGVAGTHRKPNLCAVEKVSPPDRDKKCCDSGLLSLLLVQSWSVDTYAVLLLAGFVYACDGGPARVSRVR